MKPPYHLLFYFSALLFSGTSFSQNSDSVKAYILEFIDPEASFSVTYGTESMSLKYEERKPLTPKTQEFIDETLQDYEETNDPLLLYTIGQTYRRMNQRKEGEKWIERATLETETLMGTYPDSIELVEKAMIIYIDNNQPDLAALAAKMISDHYQNSKSLFSEAMTHTFSGDYNAGLALSEKGLVLYPDESKWYMARIIYEFTKKMNIYGFNTEGFNAKENRIDRSFLDEGLAQYPQSSEIQLVSALGNFFLFAYEEVLPKFYEQLSGDIKIEGFDFELSQALDEKMEVHFKRITELSNKKELKKWHTIKYTLGVIHMLRSNTHKAIQYFEEAIDLMKPKYRSSQDNVYHYYDNLILCHRILGDRTSAEKCAIARATEEINLDPLPQYYIEMALYRVVDEDYKAAHKLLDEAIGLDSTAVSAYSNKAMAFMLTDELDQADNYLRKAQMMDENDLVTFKATILFNLLKQETANAVQQIDHLEAYDNTDFFIKDVRRLLKTN